VKRGAAAALFPGTAYRSALRGAAALLLGQGWVWADAVTVLLAFQHYPDERHGGPERHARESRDGWGGYGSDRRMNEGRGIPPQTRLVLGTPGSVVLVLRSRRGETFRG